MHVENLYTDNKEKSEKIEQLYELRLKDKDNTIEEKNHTIKELKQIIEEKNQIISYQI